MKPSIQTLGQILYSPSQYVIPVFQRNYRWEAPQWAKLWNGLVEIQSPEKRGNHFMGFLVFVPGLAQPGQHTTFHLIDGQQRLTTSSLLLAAVRNVARDIGQADLADEIHQYYLVHPLKKGEQHFRLLPKEHDHDSYLSIVTERGEATGRTADALSYFEQKLAELAESAPDQLRQMFDTMCQRLEFMCATLEAENAYNIFKSLNSTGVPLGSSDLIRNFVFMHVPPEEHDEFDREMWGPLESRFATNGTLDEERFSKFFRDFLMAGGRYVPPRETFASFESQYEATDFSPKHLAVDLTKSSENYSIIVGDTPDADERVTRAIQELNFLESSTTYPLLLALFERRAHGVIDNDQLVHAIGMLRGFILRRFVCGESSRGYGRMFVRGLVKQNGDPISALEAYLLERGWPDDHQFEQAFERFPLYERDYCRVILEALESARGHREPADLKATQIEHILPQTLSEPWRQSLGINAAQIQSEWLHRPGNLTLSAYNLELWNHPFSTKRERYAQSNIVLTRELADYEHWTETELRERGQQLAAEAAKIWIGPREKVRQAKLDSTDDDESPGRRVLRQHFWSGLKDYLAEQNPDLAEFEVRASPSIRLQSGVRHIGIDLTFGLRSSQASIEIWFWRGASFPVWERIRASPEPYVDLVNAEWKFEQIAGQPRGSMSISVPLTDPRDESSWTHAYQWFFERLALVYDRVIPKLREEMERSEAGS